MHVYTHTVGLPAKFKYSLRLCLRCCPLGCERSQRKASHSHISSSALLLLSNLKVTFRNVTDGQPRWNAFLFRGCLSLSFPHLLSWACLAASPVYLSLLSRFFSPAPPLVASPNCSGAPVTSRRWSCGARAPVTYQPAHPPSLLRSACMIFIKVVIK